MSSAKQRSHTPAQKNDVNQCNDLEGDFFSPTFDDFIVPTFITFEFSAYQKKSSGLLQLGRVIRHDRKFPLVASAHGVFRAELSASIIKQHTEGTVVGDWVVIDTPYQHDKHVIEYILPRRGVLSRWDGSNRGTRQILASHVDLVIAVQPISKRPVDVERLARAHVVACEGDISFAVVLSKVDRAGTQDHLNAQVLRASHAVGANVPIIAACAPRQIGIEEIRQLIAPGVCAILLGESGAGKSTLVNTLLNAEVLGTGSVRQKDDRGRHTTVARRMVKMHNAGLIVDAPGLRAINLLDETYGLAQAFKEVSDLEPLCRFRDCTHGEEPGCALTRAVLDAKVTAQRLELYRLLASEMKVNRRGLDLAAAASITK